MIYILITYRQHHSFTYSSYRAGLHLGKMHLFYVHGRVEQSLSHEDCFILYHRTWFSILRRWYCLYKPTTLWRILRACLHVPSMAIIAALDGNSSHGMASSDGNRTYGDLPDKSFSRFGSFLGSFNFLVRNTWQDSRAASNNGTVLSGLFISKGCWSNVQKYIF